MTLSKPPKYCGECMLWAGQLNIGVCMLESSPVYQQDRWFTDKPACRHTEAERQEGGK